MKTCIICTLKHIASAEIFVHEANSGYPMHLVKAYGQLDHAEMEIASDWPELVPYIHVAKKVLSDAIDTGNVTLAKRVDFDALQALLLSVEGKDNLINQGANNAKVYTLNEWVKLGQDIRYRRGLTVPQSFVDTLYNEGEHTGSNGHTQLTVGELADLGELRRDI